MFKLSNGIHYLFTGDCVVLVHVPLRVNPEAYYWMGVPTSGMPEIEKTDIASLIRPELVGKKFGLKTRPGQKFVITAIGEFK